MKYSRQRDAIRECMKGRTDHPTAEMVYADVRKVIPNISLGTVYRNLNILHQERELLMIDCGDGVERYDPNHEAHVHFFCNCCKKVKDVELVGNVFMPEQDTDGDVFEECSIVVRGTCADCKDKSAAVWAG